MPSYIVRKRANTKDGSLLGRSQVMVTAPDERQAKESGAEQLGVSVQHVEATKYANHFWSELRGS